MQVITKFDHTLNVMSLGIVFKAEIKRRRFWQFTWKYSRNYEKGAVEELARM